MNGSKADRRAISEGTYKGINEGKLVVIQGQM